VLESVTVASEASVGIALYPEHGADAEILLQRADVAMYMAKEERSGHACYAPESDPYDPKRAIAKLDELSAMGVRWRSWRRGWSPRTPSLSSGPSAATRPRASS
jgi:predicted signal transduction protein with EAL and GGDEF domain